MSVDNKKFSIGQIVYVLSSKNTVVVPVMIVEEVTIQTLNGKRTSWKFAVGSPEKQKIVESKQLDGDLYSSLEEIKTLLTNRLSKFIDQTISNAFKQEDAWYGQQLRKAKQAGLVTQESQKIDPSSLLDNIDSVQGQGFMSQITQDMDKEEQKRKMREMLEAESDEENADSIAVSTVIENGVKVRVHLPE